MTYELKEQLLSSFQKLRIISIQKTFTFAELIREDLKSFAKEEYILFVDHDEVIPPSLKNFILENYKKYDYMSIPRKNIIFNKWIKHSRWWPDYQIRLIKKDKVFWEKDIDIHKQPELKGKGLIIEAKEELAMIHYNYQNIDEYITKALHYAKQEANQIVRKNKKFSLSQALSLSISEFVSRYYADEGYKDGMHGFVLATLQMFYFFLVFY
jgi:(heptosyl)LPS beta-1,4-glucosyltransferase